MKVIQYTGKYKSKESNWNKWLGECDNILDGLKKFRVLSIKKMDDGHILFTDGCDEYFNLALTPEQVKQFILELEKFIE